MISHYLRILRRGAVVVVATTIAVAGIAYATSSVQEHRYTSSAEVFLAGARNLPNAIAEAASQFYTDPVRLANTQAALARTPEVAQRAVRESGVKGRPANQ